MEPCQKLFQNCQVPGGIFFAALAYLPHLQVCSFLYIFISAVSGDSSGPDLLASNLSVWGNMSNIYFKLNSLLDLQRMQLVWKSLEHLQQGRFIK